MTPFNKRTQRQTFEQEITEIAVCFTALVVVFLKLHKIRLRGGTVSLRSVSRGTRGRAPIPSLPCDELSPLEDQHENLRKIKRFPRIAGSTSLDVINRSYLCKRTQRQTLEQEITEIAKGFLLYGACGRVSKAAQNLSAGRDRVLAVRFSRRARDAHLSRRCPAAS
jgi:hypothetical protein